MTAVVTNADRVLFPASGQTKGDVVAYYQRAAARMLPHLLRRPLTMLRCPRGVGQKGFFQKNAPKHYPASLERVEVGRREGVTVHPTVGDAEGLAYLANQGALELHVPTVRAPLLSHPDRIIVDLDPPPGAVALVRRAAVTMKDELEALGLPSIPMTTGSKGYHVIAAVEPTVDLETISTAMQQLAALVAHSRPDLYTTAFRVAKRGGRVFVDWMRNRHAATGVAPFSLRARAGAPVAVPIEWTEIEEVAPDGYRLESIDARLDRSDSLAALAERPADPAPFVEAVGAAFLGAGLVLESFDRFRA